MVMQGHDRILTPEEIRGLPPMSEAEIERARLAAERFLQLAARVRARVLESREGIPFTEDEIDELLTEEDEDILGC